MQEALLSHDAPKAQVTVQQSLVLEKLQPPLAEQNLALINLVKVGALESSSGPKKHPLSESALVGTPFSPSPASKPPPAMSALRKALPAAVRELRVFGCQQSPGSEGVR